MRINRFLDETKVILDSTPNILISWKTFFWTIPVSVIGTIYVNPVPINKPEDLLLWLLIAAIGHGAMIPFVLYSKGKRDVRDQIFLLILMGITRGSIMSLLVPLLHVIDPLPIYFRILNSLVANFYWFIVGAILIQFMSTFRNDVRKLLEESILRDKSIELPAHDVNSSILLTRISELQKTISSTLAANPTRDNLNKRARDIDKLVKEQIRPLSRSEWREGDLVYVKAGFLRIIFTTLQNRALPLWGIIVLTLPYSLVGQVYRFGFIRTFVLQIIWILLAVLTRDLIFKILPAKNGKYFRQNILQIICSFLVIAPIIFWMHMNWPGNTFAAEDILRLQLARTLSFGILCCVTAICVALTEEERSVFRTISQQLKSDDPQSFLELSAKAQAEANYAQYLHAEVQSQLLACKLLLLKSAESDFTLFPPEVTQQILERLEKINHPYERGPSKLPSKRLEEMSASWKGLANITFNVVPQLDGADAPHDVIGQLIEEAVVNAIRHGKAKNVHIKAFAYESAFAVEVADDGASDFYTKGSGLGTILFDTFTQDWSIGREADKTVVRFSVARQA